VGSAESCNTAQEKGENSSPAVGILISIRFGLCTTIISAFACLERPASKMSVSVLCGMGVQNLLSHF